MFIQCEQDAGNQYLQSLRMAEGQGMVLRISFRYTVIGRFLDIFLISFIFLLDTSWKEEKYRYLPIAKHI